MTGIIGKMLPGVAGMPNIHPMLVHFPLAFLTGFLILELFGVVLRREDLRTAATWALYLGAIGAMGAVAAGLFAAATVPHGEGVHETMTGHRNLGITVLSLAVVLSVWRAVVRGRFSPKAEAVHLAMAFVTVVTMAFGGDLGGLMVYTHGVGVAAAERPAGHGHDHSHSEAAEAVAGDVNGEGGSHGSGHDHGHDHPEPHGH